MKIKELIKRTAVYTMAAVMAFTAAAFVSADASVVEAAEASSVSPASGTYDLKNGSVTLVSYKVTADCLQRDFNIVITKDNEYTGSITADNIRSIGTSETGVYAAVHVDKSENLPNGTQYITTTTTGTYRVYYSNYSTNGELRYSNNIVVTDTRTTGIDITRRTFNVYGYGFDAEFRVASETVSYEWIVYDKVPGNANKNTLDYGSGSTSTKNEIFSFTTNNLEKNTNYYLVLTVTGDTTRKKATYNDGYYQFKTKNSDTWATGTSSSSSTTTKKTNSDGSVTETTTTTKDGVKTTTQTTKYSNKTVTHVESTPVSSSTDWKKNVIDATVNNDGSATQTMVTTMRDNTTQRKEATTSSGGTTRITNASYSAQGAITALSTEIDNSSNTSVLAITYGLGSGSNISLKKVTVGKKATVNVPETVTANGVEYSVTSVDANAFKGNSSVKKLVLPDSVTKVGANAFKSDKNLKTVVINNKLTSVGTNAFKSIKSGALIKIGVSGSAYNNTVKRIKKSGVNSSVKFKSF